MFVVCGTITHWIKKIHIPHQRIPCFEFKISRNLDSSSRCFVNKFRGGLIQELNSQPSPIKKRNQPTMTLEVNQDLGEKGKHSGIVGCEPRKMNGCFTREYFRPPGSSEQTKASWLHVPAVNLLGVYKAPLWKTNGRYGRKVIKRKSSTWTSMEGLWICPPAAHQEPHFMPCFRFGRLPRIPDPLAFLRIRITKRHFSYEDRKRWGGRWGSSGVIFVSITGDGRILCRNSW